MKRTRMLTTLLITALLTSRAAADPPPQTLAATKPLTMEGDIASQMIAGADRLLLNEIERSVGQRARHWQRDASSHAAYIKSIEPNRERFLRIIGLRDQRVKFDEMELLATTGRSALVGKGEGFEVYAVRWPVLNGIHAEGLLLRPIERGAVADVVAIPDAGQTPEMLVGLAAGIAPESQFARRLAESGCRVIVPAIIDRGTQLSVAAGGTRHVNITHRELLYRPAFQLGRHIIGYEVQKVLAAVDWFTAEAGGGDTPVGVIGYGEGGLLAFYSAAVDARIDVAGVSGYFDSRQNIWQEPLDRNVFGLLYEFGDAEIASLITPRSLIVEASALPHVTIPPGTGGGPGRLVTPALDAVHKELDRARGLVEELTPQPEMELIVSKDGKGPPGTDAFLNAILKRVAGEHDPVVTVAQRRDSKSRSVATAAADARGDNTRLFRQYDDINSFTQNLLLNSPFVRDQFMSKADRQSRDPENFKQSMKWYREYFRDEVVGRFDYKLADFNARSRKIIDTPTRVGYEVVLDVFPPHLFAYGILQIPKDVKAGEKRPVVVCQHGLESRPQDVIGKQDYEHYKAFASELCERGFITFAPQNIYIFGDRFRTLQRKANSIKKTLYSIMVPQHQQIVHWLGELDFVDPERIGFYGLSYGGKSAMYIPPLVDGYCLSICSANFIDWNWYVCIDRISGYYDAGEYEMFEFDLANTFNYSEMAALICPRPMMAERGYLDAPGGRHRRIERVVGEFGKVSHLYAELGIGDRSESEWFYGGHEINSKLTFDFLHKHLHWPKSKDDSKPNGDR
jgi:dienelactone hydrolase